MIAPDNDEWTHTDDDVDLLVAGAGLAGLAAAAVAAGEAGPGPRVLVVDGRSIGGRARTDRRGEFLFNQGGHALYRGGEARAVLGRLGIRPAGGRPPLDQTFGWRDGEVARMPADASSLMGTPLLGLRSKLRTGWLLARMSRLRPVELAGQSMAGWISELGLRADAEDLVVSLARTATYSSELGALSADAGVGQVQRAMVSGVEYLDGGWQQLVDATAAVAADRGVGLRTGARLATVEPATGFDGWMATFVDGRQVRARTVILALGSPAACIGVLGHDPGWGPEVVGPEVTAACLDLGLRRPPERPLLMGVGERCPMFLTTHAPTARLAPEGQALVHTIRYGARTAEADRTDLWELVAAAGIDQADVIADRFLHRMVVAHGMPRPGPGLAGRPAVAVPDRPGVFVAGDWVGSEGLLADASLASAEVAARSAAAHLQGAPDLVGGP